jgi:hypothetical protein
VDMDNSNLRYKFGRLLVTELDIMDEATLGAESRMSKRVPVTSTTGCIS